MWNDFWWTYCESFTANTSFNVSRLWNYQSICRTMAQTVLHNRHHTQNTKILITIIIIMLNSSQNCWHAGVYVLKRFSIILHLRHEPRLRHSIIIHAFLPILHFPLFTSHTTPRTQQISITNDLNTFTHSNQLHSNIETPNWKWMFDLSRFNPYHPAPKLSNHYSQSRKKKPLHCINFGILCIFRNCSLILRFQWIGNFRVVYFVILE